MKWSWIFPNQAKNLFADKSIPELLQKPILMRFELGADNSMVNGSNAIVVNIKTIKTEMKLRLPNLCGGWQKAVELVFENTDLCQHN